MTKHFRSLAAALILGAPFAFSVDTQSWVHNDRTDFEKGTLKGLSMRSDGRLTLAPQFRELADPSIAYLWALAVDSKGTLYSGGGSPGSPNAKLVTVDPQGKSRTVAEIPGLQIQTIAVDKQDRVYVGTAPDGKVYRVGADGKADVFYDPKARYIWSLAFNSRGDLFVATGDSGEIHRVTPNGQGSVFFRTEETHARSLAVDAKDNLIVGTEPGGLVLRITPAGDGFVLYQTAKREVTAVAVAQDGVIYAAAIGKKGGSSPLAVPVPQPSPAPAPAAAGTAPSAAPAAARHPSAPPAAPPSVAGGSEVYRIGTDGYPQRMWTNPTDIVYSIAFDRTGTPVLSTGNKGNIYRLDSDRYSTLLINSEPTQVTALASGPGGRLYAATGNVGKIYSVGPGLEPTGTYESEALDTGFFSLWGRASTKTELHGGGVKLETRSGNLDRPQKNWSPWAPLDAAGRVASPSARFLQYRLTMTGANASPELREIELAYKTKNVPPVITDVEITPANYRFSAATTISLTTPATLTLPPIGSKRAASVSPTSLDATTSSSMTYAKGYTGARWAVNDPNGDSVLSKVEIRGLNEKDWKLLRDKVKEKYISFDSSAFPDGDYVLRITVSDSPDNPPDQALTAAVDSDRFGIDNTPPAIANLTATRAGTTVTVRWQARDNKGIVSRAEYSLNGGEWTVVDPTSKLSDAPQLDYNLTVEAGPGEAVVAVRVTDEYDNQSVAKAVVR